MQKFMLLIIVCCLFSCGPAIPGIVAGKVVEFDYTDKNSGITMPLRGRILETDNTRALVHLLGEEFGNDIQFWVDFEHINVYRILSSYEVVTLKNERMRKLLNR